MRKIKSSKTFLLIITLIAAGGSYYLFQIYHKDDGKYKAQKMALRKPAEDIDHSLAKLHVQDANLRRCIKNTAAKFGNVVAAHHFKVHSALELKSLDCRNRQISSLQGIQALKKMDQLDLNRNNISDIRPLMALVNLKRLQLDNNPISSIEPLRHLTRLEEVSLGKTRISNVDALAELHHLKELYLYSDVIGDVNAIPNMPSLVKVGLPDMSHYFCTDVIKLTSEANFEIAHRQLFQHNCLGNEETHNRVSRLVAKKQSGGELTKEEEMLVLQYEINKQKEENNEKYNDSNLTED
ncbi:MAG: leucine-rich repeat domain-containing protein [Gammaproteobacteria bacterium]